MLENVGDSFAMVDRDRESALIGRRRETHALNRLLEDVWASHSRALVLRGEPGVGKSALLDYLLRRASGCHIARAAGVESETELSYAGLHQLCAPVLDRRERLPAPQRDALAAAFGLSADPAPDRFVVGLAALGLLSEVAAERPLVCVIDDAQWLDQASSHTVGFVSRRLLRHPVAIVCAARRGIADDGLAGLPELAVDGLDDSDARSLLLDALRGPLDAPVCDQVIAESRGNPQALLELPRNWSAAELAGGFGLPGSGSPAGTVELSYAGRIEALPSGTRLLLVAAAAEPLGNPVLLHRAAQTLGVDTAAADPAVDAGLIKIGARVEFAHPLLRTAAYRSATANDRRRVHLALAAATDAETDPDRRAWHCARAIPGPDEELAAELERCASRAGRRGGTAAAAAFLERSVALTVVPARRGQRALAAAQASLRAGAFDSALRLVAAAETGPLDEHQRARADLLRAEIALASDRDSAAPALLLRTAEKMEHFVTEAARDADLELRAAALFAARLGGPADGVQNVAEALQAGRPTATPQGVPELLLEGWAAFFADGYAAATPTLRAALLEFDDRMVTAEQLHLLRLVTMTASVVWDGARWDLLSRRHLELARDGGVLSELPRALNERACNRLFRGELDTAASLIEEARATIQATGANHTPWGAVGLAALRGREHAATTILEVASGDSTTRGQGIGVTVMAWARSIYYNGLGAYDKALAAAREAIECPVDGALSAWGMVELVEAAARAGQPEVAADASGLFAKIASAAGTDWALGVDARSRALLCTGARAEQLYREALDHLGRGEMRVDVARAHLVYGEWLRRDGRRVDARAHLRTAHDMLHTIGAEAFAERARRELLAVGDKVRKRRPDTRDELTPQELQIARLARDGLSNPEIGERLFLSPRTVEWHLRKVFGKLGIRSRRELADALLNPDAQLASA